MRRINLPLLLDTLFAGACAFLLFFTAIRYYTKNAVIALVFAVTACLLFGALGFLYISRKQNKKLLISRNEKNKKLLALHLSLSSDAYVCALLSDCLKADGDKPVIKNGKILTNDCVYFVNFKMQPLCEDDVAAIIKTKTEKKKLLFCCAVAPEAAALAENFSIEIKQLDYVYALLEEKKLLPEKYIYEGAKKINVFKRIKMRFNRKICAPLFWSGAALLALSYFTFFPIYYIISGSIMLILAAVTLVLA